MTSRNIGIVLPEWMYKQMIESKDGKISDRVKELITKGYIYEQQQSQTLKQDYKNEKNPENAVSRILSADYEDIPRSFGGFPEAAV